MKFDSPLIKGKLINRYKRFLADVERPDGQIITAHTANTGSMSGCSTPGATVWLRHCPSPTRKYDYTWELIESPEKVLIGINTARANDLVEEAIRSGTVRELQGYSQIRREVPYGMERSRIDLLLENPEQASCYVEVKNVTLMRDRTALFPDAVTRRGSKHLRELENMVSCGFRAVIFYCIPRPDAADFSPADDIDPEYGQALRQAISAGVEVLAYRADVSSSEIRLAEKVAISLPAIN